jgi:hypothetical protein
MSSVTSKFVKEFDPSNSVHVKWLAHMTDVAENFNDPNKPMSIVEEINSNPMNIKIEDRDALDWFHIHFVISAVYAKAVLRGKAFIPPTDTAH